MSDNKKHANTFKLALFLDKCKIIFEFMILKQLPAFPSQEKNIKQIYVMWCHNDSDTSPRSVASPPTWCFKHF